jgi:LuxR family maltose regulon positive regulatory protein
VPAAIGARRAKLTARAPPVLSAVRRDGRSARPPAPRRAGGIIGRPVEQLTARELAVLRMLPLRMSNREMAGQMYISVNTLKTHVRSIYRKLDVPHRSAAVRRAKALQLV